MVNGEGGKVVHKAKGSCEMQYVPGPLCAAAFPTLRPGGSSSSGGQSITSTSLYFVFTSCSVTATDDSTEKSCTNVQQNRSIYKCGRAVRWYCCHHTFSAEFLNSSNNLDITSRTVKSGCVSKVTPKMAFILSVKCLSSLSRKLMQRGMVSNWKVVRSFCMAMYTRCTSCKDTMEHRNKELSLMGPWWMDCREGGIGNNTRH